MKKGKASTCSSRPLNGEDNKKKTAQKMSTSAKGASNNEQDSEETKTPIWGTGRSLSKSRESMNKLRVETTRSDSIERRKDRESNAQPNERNWEHEGEFNTRKRAKPQDSVNADDAGNQSNRRSTRVSHFRMKNTEIDARKIDGSANEQDKLEKPSNKVKLSPKETKHKCSRKRNEKTIANQMHNDTIMSSAKKKKRTDREETTDTTSADSQHDSDVKVEPSIDKTFSCAIPGYGKLIGAHCSIAGGLSNAVKEAVSLGGHAIGLFLKSQRSWKSKPMDSATVDKFKAACKEHGFSPNSILPHGSYLLNCGSPNPDTWKKSREGLLDELQRCEALGLTLFNFHPGSTCGEMTVDECLDKIADCINWAHAQTKFVITVIENMSCQGNTVGGRFEELRGIIERVEDKTRVGICLDTCHAFAAGFDLATEEGYKKFVSDFDSIVGFQYLKAMHLNDSKGAVGCHLDRHENIGKGFIGLDGFQRLMSDLRFDGIPMILETPPGAYEKEIKTLYKMTR